MKNSSSKSQGSQKISGGTPGNMKFGSASGGASGNSGGTPALRRFLRALKIATES